jgi:outer membrane protein TolC
MLVTLKQKGRMKLKNKFSALLILLLIAITSNGQQDSLTLLRLVDFLQLVKQHHPLAKQAELITKSADATALTAKGNFDPKLFYDFRNKFYDSKNYYELGNGGFKIPTWFGLELKGGYEQNQGTYLNPENTVPNQGLVYSQISLPLLQGLIIDERRATLKQAKLFQELSVFDKINTINELLYKAGKAYWEWQLTYTNLQVHQNAVTISQERFNAVRKTSALGDRPAIDTVEANIQLQDRIINLQQALMDYRTKSLLLSNYLWLENDVPIELTEKTIPETATINYEKENILLTNAFKMDSLINAHPNLKMYDFKLRQLTVEKKLKQDKLKPSLNVNYNPLFNAENINMGYQNNYKWGVTVGFPILLRKERGDLQLTKIKIATTTYDNLNKRNELMNKVKSTINEYNTYKNQIAIYSKNVINYERLWQSEKRLFDSGESSLFMINSREMSYINAQLKLNEIINKNKKAALDAEYSFGLLNTIY